MNILPKKRWHVRTKENIERVRRDEEQAAQEEKEKLRRIALAESEARTDLLRIKARKRQRNDDQVHEDRVVESSTSSGHVNFFEEIEKGEKQKKTNDEYEEEKKQEKEKQEKAIGLLTYLGQSAVEAQDKKPWYFEPPKKKKKSSEKDKPSREEFDVKGKLRQDPMLDMMKLVETTKKVEDRKKNKSHKHSHKAEKKHKHKHKKHKHSRREDSDSPDSNKKSSGKKTIEQLRAERLKREQEERKKTHELLARVHGGQHLKEEDVIDEREMGYNSQFNPSLARKRKPQSEWD